MSDPQAGSAPADPADPTVALVAAAVQASTKYRHIAPALVTSLAARELGAGARPKDAVKAVKNKLHQVAGAYQAEPRGAAGSLDGVRRDMPPDELQAFCRAQMARHASTRERLPILDEFYRTVFAGLPPIGSLLDLACGLNPLALPWMDLSPAAAYWACDIYADQAALLNDWFGALGQAGGAFLCDLTGGPPPQKADVVLLLKALPCLQQLDRDLGRRLLAAIDAPVLIVSYPAHSLGGRKHGMAAQYAAQFAELVAGQPWRIERFSFTTELVYRIWR
jgi:16S rRNA (guanine(1405)-N(7))-methyltransferase